MDAANLQDYFEQQSPEGVGAAISLRAVETIARREVERLSRNRVDGVNQNIPLYPIIRVRAAFDPQPATFVIDSAYGTLSLKLTVWLHTAGTPSEKIITFEYEIQAAPITPVPDQSSLRIYLEPDATSQLLLNSQMKASNADAILIRLGFTDSAGAADWARFDQEVTYPFIWLNARGMIRAIFRSIPLPQLFSLFQTMIPVPPVQAQVVGGHLLAWTKKAEVSLPLCGSQTPKPPKAQTWAASTGVPRPWSPWDSYEPDFILYYSAVPLLDWHAGVVAPGVVIRNEQDGVVGWGAYAAIGVTSLHLVFQPSMTGGSIAGHLTFDVLGVASAWLTGPCNVRLDLITATLTATGDADAVFAVNLDIAAKQLKSALSINGSIDPRSVNLSSGGLFSLILVELVEWLVKSGILRVDTSFGDRADAVLMDLETLPFPLVRVMGRVAEGSVMFTLVQGDREGVAREVERVRLVRG